MKVALLNFISKGFYGFYDNYENLGIECINAYLRENGINSEILNIFIDDDEEVSDVQKSKTMGYDIYGFSIYHNVADYAYLLARQIKQLNPSSYICCGSKFASSANDEILNDCEYIDFIVIGDGEEPFLTAINKIIVGEGIDNIESIRTRNSTNPIQLVANQVNIQKMPIPTRDILSSNNKLLVARLSTSRGCCANCSFCGVRNLKGKQGWIGRDIEEAVDEVIKIHETYNISSFLICDGSFEDPGLLGKERIRKFCNKILKYDAKLAFRCFIRGESFNENDEELIKLMRKAGITLVLIGIESVSKTDLDLYNKKANTLQSSKSLELFLKNDIDVIPGFIMFNPISNENSIRDNYIFMSDMNFSIISRYISKLEIYYNTDIYHEIKSKNLLRDDYNYKHPDRYIFDNKFVESLYKVIEETILASSLTEHDIKCLNFTQFVGFFKALFPDEIQFYLNDYKINIGNIAQILSKYFRILYFDQDLAKFKEYFSSFESELQEEYIKMQRLQMKVLKNKTMHSFLITSR